MTLPLLLAGIQLTAAAAGPPPGPDGGLEAALVAAVRARLGEAAEVRLDDLHVPPDFAGRPVYARLDPGARLGGTVHFNLARRDPATGKPQGFTGSARATLRVWLPHLHARRDIAPGETIAAADVEVVQHQMPAGAIEPWPDAAAIGTSQAVRPLAAGSCLGRTSLRQLPAVRPGQAVDVIARIGAVEAVGRLVAADRGRVGEVVRVVNPESRRGLRARVLAPGVVEVIP